MKVGMIGLGQLGESISRRLILNKIEVHGYRRNYEKASDAYDKKYYTGVNTNIKYLVRSVKESWIYGEKSGDTVVQRSPGIFQLAVPKESIDEVMDELLQFCSEGDIIINYCNCDANVSRKWAEQLPKVGVQYIDVGIAGGISGLDHGYGLVVTGGKYAVDTCRTIFDAISMGIRPSSTKNDYVMYPQDYGWIYRDW
jgi:6-phosphogluconate dehydrogenase